MRRSTVNLQSCLKGRAKPCRRFNVRNVRGTNPA